MAVGRSGRISMRVESCFWIQPHVPLDICLERRELVVDHESQICRKPMISRKSRNQENSDVWCSKAERNAVRGPRNATIRLMVADGRLHTKFGIDLRVPGRLSSQLTPSCHRLNRDAGGVFLMPSSFLVLRPSTVCAFPFPARGWWFTRR